MPAYPGCPGKETVKRVFICVYSLPIAGCVVWLVCKECHEKALRPALGHPAQQDTLSSLCEQEDDRHENAMGTITAYTSAQKVTTTDYDM